MELEELKVIISAETSGLRDGLSNVQKQVSSFQQNVSQSTAKASSAFSKLGKVAVIAGLTKALFSLGKQAINTASDLAEVQNVVDVTFGQSASTINEWSQNTLKAFGLSELSAKQYAGTMGAMLKSSGVTGEAVTDMSMRITELAGDMASFYNLDADVAFQKIRSGISGETEPLKQLGINMSVANLEAYALSKGITKTYNSMSQAEQVLLRYNYLMEVSADAQGDFARTSGSWANQVKLLKEQWSQLLGILGQALTKVLTPMVQALNQILSSAISIANAMAKAFGWSGIESTSASVSSIADGMDSAIDSTNEETKAAKKLNNVLSGFDELNIYDSGKSDSSDSSGSFDLGGVTTTATSSVVEGANENIQKFKDFLDTIRGIFDKWFQDLPEIKFNFDWGQAKEDLLNIGEDIANIIAGWTEFAIHITIDIGNDLDMGRLLNDIISVTEAISDLASTITDILVPILENFYEKYLSPIVQWIGEKLHKALVATKEKIKDLTQFIEEHKEGINAWVEILGKIISALWKIIEPLADVIWEVWSARLETIYGIVKLLVGIFLDLGEVILACFEDPEHAIEILQQKMTKWKDQFSQLGQHLWDTWSGVAEKILSKFKKAFESILQVGKSIAQGLWNFIKTVFSAAPQFFSNIWTTIKTTVTNIVSSIKEYVSTAFTNLWNTIKTGASTLITNLKSFFSQFPQHITNILASVLSMFTACWNRLSEGASNAWEKLKTGASNAVEGVKEAFKVIPEWFKTTFTDAWTKVKEVFSSGGKIFDGIKEGILSGLKSVINALIRGINKVISVPFNGLNTALSKIRSFELFGVRPFKNIGSVNVPEIPELAKGGVIDKPTLAMIGEKRQTEIVAPQTLLEKIVRDGNNEMASVYAQIGRQIIQAINGIDMNVSIGDDIIARSAQRGNNSYYMRTGKALLV